MSDNSADEYGYPFQGITDYVTEQVANARADGYVTGLMHGLQLAQEEWHASQGHGHNETADTYRFSRELAKMLTNARVLFEVAKGRRG